MGETVTDQCAQCHKWAPVAEGEYFAMHSFGAANLFECGECRAKAEAKRKAREAASKAA